MYFDLRRQLFLNSWSASIEFGVWDE